MRLAYEYVHRGNLNIMILVSTLHGLYSNILLGTANCVTNSFFWDGPKISCTIYIFFGGKTKYFFLIQHFALRLESAVFLTFAFIN